MPTAPPATREFVMGTGATRAVDHRHLLSVRSVSLFLPSFAGGGAERATILLARALFEAGLEVELIVPTTNGPLLEYARSTAVEIVDLGTGRVRYSVAKLARHLRSRSPDALIAVPNDTVFFAHLARRLSGTKPLLVSMVQNSWDRYRPSNGFQPVARVIASAFTWALGRADLVVSISNGVRESLFAGTGVDSITITDPLDFSMIKEKAREDPHHRWFGGENFVVIGVGRLTEQKDFPMLIEAFRISSARQPNAKLMILGDGHLRAYLQQLISDQGLNESVQLVGFVDNPWSYIARADVLAMSSRFEGLGLVLIEALACGTAVVATDCHHGPREALDDGRLGRLVPVGDSQAMADAILETATSPTQIVDLEELKAKYSPDTVAAQFIEAIQSAG